MRRLAQSLIVLSWYHTACSARAFADSTTPSSRATITSAPASSTPAPVCTAGEFEVGISSLYTGYSTNPALQCSCMLDLHSWLYTTAPPTRTIRLTEAHGITTQTIVSSGTTVTETSIAVSTFTTTAVANDIYGGMNFWYGSATSPCCYSCTVAAATVNLLYWPTPAIPLAPTSFVSDGFTYISPSVYIGFTSLAAFDYCGSVGKSYSNTTIAFAPHELSSFVPVTTSIVFTEFSTPSGSGPAITITSTESVITTGTPASINYRDLGQNCSTISGYTYIPGNPQETVGGKSVADACHPTIALPSRVKSVDPAWASCVNNGIGGFYDPPYALQSVGQLIPSTSSTAAPESTPDNGLPPTTALPDQSPTTSPSPPPPADPSTVANPPPPANTGLGSTGNGNGDGNGAGNDPSPLAGQPGNNSPGNSPPSGQPNSPPSNGNGGSPQEPPANQPGGTQGNGNGSPSGNNPSPQGPPDDGGSLTQVPLPVITIGGLTVTQNPSSQFIVGSQTLVPGGSAVTVGDSTVSLPATGSVVVVNRITTPMATATETVVIVSGLTTPITATATAASSVPTQGGSGNSPVAGGGTSGNSSTGPLQLKATASRPDFTLTFWASTVLAMVVFALHM